MDNQDARTKQEQETTQPAGKGGNEMATVRSIISSILVALIAIAGHASAHTISDYDYIHQHLAVQQGTWIDTNGDGTGNILAYDVNRDGRWDALRYSTFHNRYLNVVALDISGNGSFSSVRLYSDTTGSGRFDVAYEFHASGRYYALDPDEDGHYTAWASCPTPGVQSMPKPKDPNGGLPPHVAAQLQHPQIPVGPSWLAPACHTSDNGWR